MRRINTFRTFESSDFYDPSPDDRTRLRKWIEEKLDGKDLNMVGWIYSNIIRGKDHRVDPGLRDWCAKASPKWKAYLDGLMSKYGKTNGYVQAMQDGQGEWFQFSFNSRYRDRIKSERTYNHYVTFVKTEENLKKWFNSVPSLFSMFYDACTKGELSDTHVAFKFGYAADHYLYDKDHLKFYWYREGDKNKVLGLCREWLRRNSIETEQRRYDLGFDTKGDSFGYKVARAVSGHLEDLMKKHGRKYTAAQYADWVIKMVNQTEFKM